MSRPSYAEFQAQRAEFISQEENRALGADIVLTEDEQKVNQYVMGLKRAELEAGFASPRDFAPSRHFFTVLDQISSSPLFQFLQKMPKGGILHAHELATGSMETVVKVTYKSFLWQNGKFGGSSSPLFKFSKTKPEPFDGSEWRSVADVRKEIGNDAFDKCLRSLLSLFCKDPAATYTCLNQVWERFSGMYLSLEPIVTYKPVLEEYFTRTLHELYADNVCYLEIRSILPPVYDLEGHIYSPEEVLQIYYDLTESFKKDHPDFLGVRVIYAPLRFLGDSFMNEFFETAEKLHKRFPNFLAGFDLLAQEDKGRPLTDFNERLLKMSPTMQFFFHAGETNWCGMSTDENLVRG